ncbi:ABC transporter substrate-binding protein [soil metagenome]
MVNKAEKGARVPEGKGINRRDFLKMGAAGAAGVSLLGVAGCGGGGGGQGEGPVEFTLAMGPDRSGSRDKLMEKFNKQNEAKYKVNYREAPSDTGQYFDQLRTEFQAGQTNIDLIGGDVIWPAQFAANGWIIDLSDRFAESERSKFLKGPIDANTFEGKIYGIPWYTDAGMLYYRKDWLDAAGLEPPKTWDELKQQAKQIMQEQPKAKNGFVFQGANYEGGVVDGLEYIWTHGGSVLPEGDSSKVVIDSQNSVSGLQTERSMVEEGIAPKAVASYKEPESQGVFLRGDAVFCRNWPYMYSLSADPKESQIKQDQVGIAPLPSAEGNESFSGLGGWNFFINANSDSAVQDAAYAFAEFMTEPEQQKVSALEGSLLPTRKSLYEDQEIKDKVPVITLGREALERSRPRPVSPVYSDMSLKMADQFNASLKGNTSPQDAISTLQGELTDIVEQAQ